MATNPEDAAAAAQLKDELVDCVLQIWRSHAEQVTLEESLSRLSWLSSHADEGSQADQSSGMAIPDANSKGYLYIPFDASISKDSDLFPVMQNLKVKFDAQTESCLQALNKLLDEDVKKYKIIQFAEPDPEPNSDTVPVSKLAILEKVYDAAKFSLWKEDFYPDAFEEKPATAKTPYEGQALGKITLLRVTGMDVLSLVPIAYEPTLTFPVFCNLLIAALPSGGVLANDDIAERIGNRPNFTKERWREIDAEWDYELSLTGAERLSHSYRLLEKAEYQPSKLCDDHPEWKPVDFEDQYNEMMAQIKDNEKAVLVTKTWRLRGVKRVSLRDHHPEGKQSDAQQRDQGEESGNAHDAAAGAEATGAPLPRSLTPGI
ncbi:hypothetical protein F4780DRAFT_775650 [Xylariomycetidae sp. FL0641]|nr:hypothetical protein F4780DRAFT_775650 [Xylariomycetidae sp. FL0641]